MPYVVTHWSKPLVSVTGKNAVYKHTATEAWALVQELIACEEMVEIMSASGILVGQEYLKILADEEAQKPT
jgi:hypothetical protein